jgi:hypothetical protein
MYGAQAGRTNDPQFYYHFKSGLYYVSTGGVDICSFYSVKRASDMTQALNKTFNDCGGYRSEVDRHTSAIAKVALAVDVSENPQASIGS